MPDTTSNDGERVLLITDRAAKRIAELIAADQRDGTKLRVTISGGGCSGFQYGFELDGQQNDDDLVFEHNGVKVLVDETSMDLVKGAELDYVEELIGSYFALRNPNASSTCGCGTSFSI